MCAFHGPNARRFIPRKDAPSEMLPWGQHLWYAKPGLVETSQLLVVQVDMPPGTGHAFHRHPGREEVLYLLDGQAEQWVSTEKMVLVAGDAAFVPENVVHAIYNDSDAVVRFLAILGPATTDDPELPMLVDCHDEEPWRSLRSPLKRPGGSPATAL